jgi:hypothetical protein
VPAGITAKIGHATTLPGQKRVVVPHSVQVDYAEPRIPTYNKSAHMTEALGGSVADPEWNATKDYPSFPHITTESHEGFWKPWSVCHSAPEWVVQQTIDKESILKKKQREKRDKKPVHYVGFTGDVNPWTVSKDSPEFIRGHMQQYDPQSILGKEKARLGEYGHERARKVVETSVTGSNHMAVVFGGHRSEYGHKSDRV